MNNFEAKKKLKITKLIVLFLILSISLRGKKVTTWPIMNWPVYTKYSQGFPEPTASEIEFRVYSKSGELYILKPHDIVFRGRKSIVLSAVNHAFNHRNLSIKNRNKAYLSQTINRRMKNVEIDSIEVWKLIWKVSPLSVPPLNKDKPVNEVFLGSLSS